MGLRAQVVDLVGLDLVDEPDQPGRVAEVPMVQEELDLLLVRIAVEVIYALGVEGGRAADEPVHLVALLEELLGEEGSVLAGDAGDQRAGQGGDGREPERGSAGGPTSALFWLLSREAPTLMVGGESSRATLR